MTDLEILTRIKQLKERIVIGERNDNKVLLHAISRNAQLTILNQLEQDIKNTMNKELNEMEKQENGK